MIDDEQDEIMAAHEKHGGDGPPTDPAPRNVAVIIDQEMLFGMLARINDRLDSVIGEALAMRAEMRTGFRAHTVAIGGLTTAIQALDAEMCGVDADIGELKRTAAKSNGNGHHHGSDGE